MPEDDPLQPLHTAVNCYLATLQTVAETLAQACPTVGSPYRHRLSRLRTRLAFDANPAAMEASRGILETELGEYAERAAQYVDRHGVELRRGLSGLEEIVRTLAQRQDFYGARLRQFAAQMATTPYPLDPEHLGEVVALQVAGLMSLVESMSHESKSLADRMREELARVEQRLSEAEITDPTTGLMNRREMERRIHEVTTEGREPVLLLFGFSSERLPNEVARQAGARLTAQFRHNDLDRTLDRTAILGAVSRVARDRLCAVRADRAVDRGAVSAGGRRHSGPDCGRTPGGCGYGR